MEIFGGLRRYCTTFVRDMDHAGVSRRPRGSERSIIGRIRGLRSGEEGQALIETALMVALVFLPLILGFFTLSVALTEQVLLTNAVSAGARQLASVAGVTVPGGGALTDPCASAGTAISNAAGILNQSNLSITISFTGGGSGPLQPSALTCAGTAATTYAGNIGGTATVLGTYHLTILGYTFTLKSVSSELIQ